MTSADLNSTTFGPDKPPLFQVMGGDKPPYKKFSDRFFEFMINRLDYYNDIYHAVNSFTNACLSPDEEKDCFPKDYKWVIPVVDIDWSKVADIAETMDEYARYFLLGQSLSSALTLEKLSGNLKITSTTNSSNTAFDSEVPNTGKLQKPQIESATAEMKVQSGQELAFVCLIVDSKINQKVDWGKTDAMMEAVGLALASVIYRAKGLCGNPRPFPEPYNSANPRPTLKTPNHSSWPGGHAFEVGAMATLFFCAFSRHMSDAEKVLFKVALEKGASRIAYNRERAGLHWRNDGVDGLKMGGNLMSHWLTVGKVAQYGKDGVGSLGDFLPLLKGVTTSALRTDR
jgi:hypothetical protein